MGRGIMAPYALKPEVDRYYFDSGLRLFSNDFK